MKPLRGVLARCATLLALGLATSLQAADIKTGLKAYWNFDSKNFNDAVGDFDGTEEGNSPIEFMSGKPGFGQAIHLLGPADSGGADQNILITGGEPDDLAFEGGSMSVSLWFTVDQWDKSWQAVIAKGEGGNWRIHRRGAESVMGFTGGSAGDTPTGMKAVDDGQWHHLVAVKDHDADVARLYIDGELDAERESEGPLAANGQRMRIGENPGARNRYWRGMIDDVAIWDRPLTADEVKALYANGAGKPLSSFFGTTIEILGVGAEALLGGDLTDPENDGLDALGAATDPSWNWAAITASHEPDFEGGENAFNIFDNKVGGGNDKWCCDDPTPGNPVWVAVQFPKPVSLTHFTVTSGNDTPTRDPTDWAIQGSDDGASWTDIYHFTGTVVPWTERNQVVKFTLAAPSQPYRNIRYIAYDTPANLHQLNEIEYFGNFGSSSVAYISGVRNTIETFSFRLNDEGTSVVDPASVKLALDGANVSLGTVTKVDGKIDVVYRPASPFLPSSPHTYAIEAKDNFGNVIASAGDFTTARYALLTSGLKVNPDASKRGFRWSVHQNASFQANDNVRPLNQLAGRLGENQADPFAPGIAIDLGKPELPGNLPIVFEIDTVINLDQNGGSNGEFQPDDQMPGIPGITGSTDGIAGQIDTYIELPAGPTTFIVNSDDGFITTAGVPSDVFLAQFAGEFSGGRGAADTAYTVYAAEAGVYAFRTVWEEGGGGANIEWKTVKADGTRALINDTVNGGLKAYRAASGGGQTVISSITPGRGASGVAFDSPIAVTILEASPAVDLASVKLMVDGAAVSATPQKTGNTITISYTPATFPAPGSAHTATISYMAGGNTRTETWSFTVGNYVVLGRSHQAVSVDKTKPGFLWNVFQNETVTHTSLAQTELALAGQLKDSTGAILDNLADPAARGIASGNGVKVGPLYRFEIPTVINLSQDGIDNAGNWTTDDVMPGIPGLNGSTDGIDAEVITFAELPAGVITMGVNSDDGFRSQAGYINVPADALVLGQFDGGRGAADTIFKFVVQEAGVYPIRTIWQEGGGGANIEIFTVKADGTKVLLNDSANGGFKSYRVGVAPNKPVGPLEFTKVTRNANGSITIEWTGGGTLETAASVTGPWQAVPGASSPYTLTPSAAQPVLFGRLRQ